MANDRARARASYPPTLLVTSRNSIITNNRPKGLPSLRATVSTDPPPPNGADGRSVTFARSTVPDISSKPAPAPSTKTPTSTNAPPSASSDPAKQDSQLPNLTPFRLPGPTTSNTSTAARLSPSLPHFDKPSSTREFAPPPPSPAPSDKPSVPVASTSATSTGSAQDRSASRRKTRRPDRYGHKDSVNLSARDRGNRGEGAVAGVLGEMERNESSDLDELSAASDDSDGEIDQHTPQRINKESSLAKAPLVHYKPDFSSCENDIIKIKEMVRQGTGSIPWAIGGGGPYNVYKCKFGTRNGSKGRKMPRCGWMLIRDESKSEKGRWIIDEEASYWYHNHPLLPLVPAPTPARKRAHSSVSASVEEDEGSPPPAPAPVPTPREKSNVIWLLDSDDEDVKPSPAIVNRGKSDYLLKQARVAPAPIASNGNTASSSRAHLSTSTSHQANPQQSTSSDDVSLESFLLSLGLGKHEGENDFMFPLMVDNSETWHTLDHLAPSFRASKTFNTPTRIEKAQIRMLLQSLRTAFESSGVGMIEEGWWKLIGEALDSGLAERRG